LIEPVLAFCEYLTSNAKRVHVLAAAGVFHSSTVLDDSRTELLWKRRQRPL
jgi:hypothetical protein